MTNLLSSFIFKPTVFQERFIDVFDVDEPISGDDPLYPSFIRNIRHVCRQCSKPYRDIIRIVVTVLYWVCFLMHGGIVFAVPLTLSY